MKSSQKLGQQIIFSIQLPRKALAGGKTWPRTAINRWRFVCAWRLYIHYTEDLLSLGCTRLWTLSSFCTLSITFIWSKNLMRLRNDHTGHIKATHLTFELPSLGIQISLGQLYCLLVRSHSWTVFLALEVFFVFWCEKIWILSIITLALLEK